MAVRIQLDKQYAHYTNLDFLAGRVFFTILTDETISAIVVKLEGECRTRLAGPRNSYSGERQDKKKTELEVHKLLYKVATVFPTPELQQSASKGSSFTLQAGNYEYPFRFKLPFNNDCSESNSMFTNINMAGLKVEMARDTNRHVKKTLPPSITGFPGEAEIKYFVKVTVVRPQFYKENYRTIADFKFLPIEPPRQPDTKQETFARRQQQFTKGIVLPAAKKGIFRKPVASTVDPDAEPPRFSVDARLPNPPIITCNEPLPLRLLVQKLSASRETVFLHMLQIELIGYTHVRAHELTRTETGSWVLISKSNMAIPLGSPEDPEGKEWKVDNSMWNQIPLPNTVAPSFDTCNISRTYELEVRVGLAHGSVGAIKPELLMLPLRIAVKVYSGIAPPQALLHAMAVAPPTQLRPQMSAFPHQLHPQSYMTNPSTPITPSYGAIPPQSGFLGGAPLAPDDAPPSYEDAMADEIGPVDGPRRDYNPPITPANSGSTGFGPDSKSSSGTRPISERLFPGSTGLTGPSRESSFDRTYNTPMHEDGDFLRTGQIPVSPVSPISPIGLGHSDPTAKRRMSDQPRSPN